MFQQISGNEKFIDQREVSKFFKEGLLSHTSEKLRKAILLSVFQKIVGNKKFMDQRGVSLFFNEGVLSHSSEKLRKGTLLCCVSEICR